MYFNYIIVRSRSNTKPNLNCCHKPSHGVIRLFLVYKTNSDFIKITHRKIICIKNRAPSSNLYVRFAFKVVELAGELHVSGKRYRQRIERHNLNIRHCQ
ncbi:IS1 family transposase [Xenorhabdus entomophaga]|uniref:IS1 family transposase n=1 Tax=Xenorhabdus entomophaga TaxID=3136257 RepID=UPI003BF5B752